MSQKGSIRKKSKTSFALYRNTESYNLSAVGAEYFYDTDKRGFDPFLWDNDPTH